MSKQPDWKFLTNLGDANPLTDGGYFIFEDTTGVYAPEAELYIPDTKEVYRFPLECDWVDEDDIKDVAECMGMEAEELNRMLNSDDTLDLAEACRCIGDYYGFENFDSYPFVLRSDEEAEERYKDYL